MPHEDLIRAQALDWVVRAGDPEFAEWDAFLLWLEASPEHGAAYDAACAAVADGAEALVPPPAVVANDDHAAPAPVPLPRRRWLAGAIAASVALVAAIGLWHGMGDRYVIETAPGTIRVAQLADGGSVTLSGGTRLELDRRAPRTARLLAGQALFHVRHNADDPFEVRVGIDRLVDAGTVFDVAVEDTGMRVAVSEGLVLFNPARQKVAIAPGHVLTRDTAGDTYALAAVPAAEVGEWREGRLTFANASLVDVARDLSRQTGVAYVAADNAGGAISGSIRIAPLRADPAALGPLLGLAVHHEGDRWVIAAR